MATPRLLNYINGAFVAPIDGEWVDNIEPATGNVLCQVAASKATEIDQAVQAAHDAFRNGPWRTWTFEQRADILDKIANKIEERLEEFAQAESRDCGKPIAAARTVDVPRAIKNFRFFAGAVRHDQTGCHQMADAINYTLRKPVGVAALVTPWNLPIYLLSWKVAPALAMGNTVVAKPSELTPMTADLLAQVIHEVGLPAGVFNLVHGYGMDAGQPLISHPKVSLVSFTGGTVTGQKVAATAAPQFKKLSLELGGKNPTVVFADCDLDKTIEGTVRAAFLNCGQVCLSGSRIFVERPIYDEYVSRFITKVKSLQVGDPSSADTTLGPLVSFPHREKVRSYIELAKTEGGVIECGGQEPNLPPPFASGAFLEPTVITGLPYTSRTATEEIFGPVVTIHPFDTEAEVTDACNSIRYGLAGSIWTSNLSLAHRMASRLETGMLWINCWLHRDLRVPFGGVKDSGVGREGGALSMEFFSEAMNVCVKYC
eukprot:GILK01004337.1.p1 GENE.GILK01004337.1~~GILK01004337.1.p1  ORF type:complete len:485 (+),score=83.49 GILK01004337.1:41-1495(+)